MAGQLAANPLQRFRPSIERALREFVGTSPDPLTRAVRYVLGWEDDAGRPTEPAAKRIRPALCLLASELVCGSAEPALPGAVSIELVHNFSLVHDEIQDRDAERHHRPTIWARLGDAQAINVGDHLFALAVRALVAADGDPGRRLRALEVLDTAVEAMIHGQWLDLEFEQRDEVGVQEYLGMVAGKTGAMLGASLEIGATLAGSDAETAARLGNWGRHVGLAFQVRDDYLGIWGDPAQTGKSNVNDLQRRKKTLPVVLALRDSRVGPLVREAYASSELSERQARELAAEMHAVGIEREAREIAEQLASEAFTQLGELRLPEAAAAELRAIAAYLIERTG